MLGHLISNFSQAVSGLNSLNKSKQSKGARGVAPLLDFLDKEGLYPEFHRITDGVNEPEVTVDGKKYLMFCSNNYLGLTQHPEVKEAAKKAIDKYGVGPGGSRVISGNVDIIEQLERKIADLTGTEDCVTFPTGYMANVAVFQAMMDPLFLDLPYRSSEGVIFSDEHNHGSIVDGIRLSKAKRVIFKHNDLGDLSRKIKENNLPNKLIVTEGVFSLEGEIIDLTKYAELAEKTGSQLMVDDAHGIGILGKNGGGTPEELSCSKRIDILMGSLDKALGGTGGFLCGDAEKIRYLRVASRSSILSSAFPTASAAAMIKAIELIQSGRELRQQLYDKAGYVRETLKKAGFRILGTDNLPAVSVLLGEEKTGIEFSKRLWAEKIFCPVFRWPAVPQNTSRLRATVMVSHTQEQIDRLIKACISAGEKAHLI